MKPSDQNTPQGATTAPRTGEDAHTPTPWRTVDLRHQKNGQIRLIGESFSDGSYIANILAANTRATANARFIVRACNNHAALVELLREIADETACFEDGPKPFSGDSYLPERFRVKIRAALAAARQ